MSYEIKLGDCLQSMRSMPNGSVDCAVTSPPYFGLRDYGHDGQIGLEETPAQFVAKLVEVFAEVHRVLRDDGTLWLNLGDSYNNAGSSRNGEGLDGNRRGGATGPDGAAGYKKRDLRHALRSHGIKHKDLLGIPWRVAFALQDFGWYLRQEIIWHKPNPMPESVTDRCTKAHEHIFLLSKSPRYYFDYEAIKETAVGGGTRNRRSVWTVPTRPYKGAHFATFPTELIEPCILAGCPDGGIVLDPFGGSGTTAGVAVAHSRRAILCELNPDYAALVPSRVESVVASISNRKPANDNSATAAKDVA